MLNFEAFCHTELPPELRQLYISHGILKIYPRNSTIVTQGKLIYNCYYVHEGFCAYVHTGYDGKSRGFNLITPGTSFGETPSMLHEPAVMNVLCLEDTKVYETPFDDMLDSMDKQQVIMLTKHSVRLNLGVRWMLRLFTTLSITQRILVFFRIYAHTLRGSGSEWLTLGFRITHERLAEIVGATRVTATVQINNLRHAGYIRTKGQFIQFHRNIISDDFILNGCHDL